MQIEGWVIHHQPPPPFSCHLSVLCSRLLPGLILLETKILILALNIFRFPAVPTPPPWPPRQVAVRRPLAAPNPPKLWYVLFDPIFSLTPSIAIL